MLKHFVFANFVSNLVSKAESHQIIGKYNNDAELGILQKKLNKNKEGTLAFQ